MKAIMSSPATATKPVMKVVSGFPRIGIILSTFMRIEDKTAAKRAETLNKVCATFVRLNFVDNWEIVGEVKAREHPITTAPIISRRPFTSGNGITGKD